MDGDRFDSLARSLGGSAPRRTIARAPIGAAFGGVAGLATRLGLEEAAAGCVKPGKLGCKGPKNKRCCEGAR